MKQLTERQLERLRQLIKDGNEDQFYSWRIWRDDARKEALKYYNYECAQCKKQGRFSPAIVVHHVKKLRDRPELATYLFDPETGEPQLLPLCKRCHEEEHPESLRQPEPAAEPVTVERWD